MRWFKHYCDMHDGRSINHLLDELGHTGLCFFLLQEMCAEKFEPRGANVEESAATFQFHSRVVRQKLRISPVNLRRLLDSCAANGLLSFEFSGSSLQIKMPILLDLLHRDSINARNRREISQKKPGLDLDKEKEEEKTKTKNIIKSKTSAEKNLNKMIWESYKNAYFLRYKVDPVRNATVNSKISQIAKRLGIEAIEVVRFYLTHNDAFYLKSLHAIGLCLTNAESLHTQWQRGVAVTGTMVRDFEKQAANQNLLNQIESGEI